MQCPLSRNNPLHIWSDDFNKDAEACIKNQLCFYFFLQKIALEKLDPHVQRVKLDLNLRPYTKANSKWIYDLDVGPKAVELLDKNIGEAL